MYPLDVGCKMFIVAAASSGKTTWCFNLIRFRKEMFPKEPPSKVMLCYSVYQSLYDDMIREIPEIILKPGLPTYDELIALGDNDQGGIDHSLLLIDDLMSELCQSRDMEKLFVNLAHHRKISVIYMAQNLFFQAKCSRTISLNMWYFVLLNARRDRRQLKQLASQILGGGKTEQFLEIFDDCTKKKYGYLFVDVSPHGEKKHMFRTNILPNEGATVIYTLK